MNTCELYRRLIMRGTNQVTLLRAAAEHVAALPDGSHDATMLLHDIASHRETPADVLATLTTQRDATIRRDVLLNPALDDDLRMRRVRSERSPVVLRALAKDSPHVDVLAHLAKRGVKNIADKQVLALLLDNDHLPLEHAAQALLVAQDVLAAKETLADEDEHLVNVVFSIFGTYKGLVPLVSGDLTWMPLRIYAARTGELDDAAWTSLEHDLVDTAAARLNPGDSLTSETEKFFNDVITARACPPKLAQKISSLIVLHAAQSRSADTARLILAQAADEAANEATASDDPVCAELAARAAGTNVEDLKQILASTTLPAPVAWTIATNPHAPVDLILAAFKRTADDVGLRQLFAAIDNPVTVSHLIWSGFGPSALEVVPREHAAEVLARVATEVADRIRLHHHSLLSGTQWGPFVEGLDVRTLLTLPWPVVRTFAGEHAVHSQWLSSQLAPLLGRPGTARLFATLDDTFQGSAGDLLAALDAATATDPSAVPPAGPDTVEGSSVAA